MLRGVSGSSCRVSSTVVSILPLFLLSAALLDVSIACNTGAAIARATAYVGSLERALPAEHVSTYLFTPHLARVLILANMLSAGCESPKRAMLLFGMEGNSPAIASVSTEINPQLPLACHMLKGEPITLARGPAATSRRAHPRRCLHTSPTPENDTQTLYLTSSHAGLIDVHVKLFCKWSVE